jgi:energy-coupling factor transporter ATP-binding protein EcfA2
VKISKVYISNILGIKELSFEPGTITVISGKNGSGKSSVLNALVAVFEGGHSPDLVNKSAKRGTIRMELDTGTVIQKTITPTKTDLEIVDANGLVIPSPRTFIKTLGESMAVDPGKLMSIDATKAAGKKELMAALFAAMPVEFTGQEVNAATNPCGVLITQPCGNLDELAKIRKGIEETRRKIGTEAKSAEGTVSELARQLQTEDGEEKDWQAEAVRLESERNSLDLQRQKKSNDLSSKANQDRQDIKSALTAEIRALEEKARTAISSIETALAAALDDLRCEMAPNFDRLTAELATAREKAQQAQRIAGAKATVETMRAKVKEKNCEYDRFTRAIEALDTLKQSKLDNLPVAGLNFDGENVLVDGVEWHNVNTAKRAEIAIQLCSMQSGELPFLVIDGSESLTDVWEPLKDAAIAAGFQVAAGKAIKGQPFKVEVQG